MSAAGVVQDSQPSTGYMPCEFRVDGPPVLACTGRGTTRIGTTIGARFGDGRTWFDYACEYHGAAVATRRLDAIKAGRE